MVLYRLLFPNSRLFVCLLLCFSAAALLFAADELRNKDRPEFIPGKEVRIDTDNKNISGGCYLAYVPSDYTDERSWPVIFFYPGLEQKPSTEFFTSVTEGKGFIVVAMDYVPHNEGRITRRQFLKYVRRELKSVITVSAHISRYLKIDRRQMFIAGISKGGWLTSALAERSARTWAGIAIFCAGRHPAAESLKKRTMRNKSVYIGTGEEDQNRPAAERTARYCRQYGAKVTFEVYEGLGHTADPNSQTLRNWLLANST